MKNIINIFKLIVYLVLFETFLINKSSAFFPQINEPNQQELQSTAIQIGKTALQLIELDQNEEAIRLLKLAIKLNSLASSAFLKILNSLNVISSKADQSKSKDPKPSYILRSKWYTSSDLDIIVSE